LQLLDGLKAQWYSKREVIVRAGDIGDLFYIVEEGHVECWGKVFNSGKKPIDRVIRKLTSGDHFGELALINNEKRTLTVKCGSRKAKLLALDRATFTRILGSIE
jgi:cAMP-dependent protein kinase regulator